MHIFTYQFVAVDDWNRNVKEFTGSMTGYLNTDRIMSVITGQYISDDSK